MDYMYNRFKNLKESLKDYQAYASGYDPHQYVRHANDSDFKFHYNPPIKTWSIQKLVNEPVPRKERIKTLASNIADNVTHTFAYGAFAVANYICPQKPGSSSDASDTDILSRATYIDEDGKQYPPERPLDDCWGLIDYDDLSVEFKSTNPPPKPPRRNMKLRK
ncbi:hypothetical protein BDF21DRAFT_425149 [Thamnidium elegans]|nr:hypothetical protein BDF21DRAFT_425149 [Thamnidium elegans]